ncbi:MAG: hypothetical protein JO060_09600, partial [Candidatus Eremiobacteraeota bacterium]|nr:hypothetical protein [Candidatus Eremiobacteraeota bacterium]
MRVLLLGYVVRGPIGGFAWSSLQYLMGLMKLGHDVYFLEDSGDDDECCYDPETSEMTNDPSFGLRYAEEIFAGSGMEQRWAYYDAHRRQWLGPCAGSTRDIWRTADALLNLSGCNSLR